MDVCGCCGGAAMVSCTWRRGAAVEGHGQAWYETGLRQLQRESVFLLLQKAVLSFASFSSSGNAGGEPAKELGNLVLFLAHLAPLYPDNLADLADQIGSLLDTNAHALPSGLLVQALILLVNWKVTLRWMRLISMLRLLSNHLGVRRYLS